MMSSSKTPKKRRGKSLFQNKQQSSPTVKKLKETRDALLQSTEDIEEFSSMVEASQELLPPVTSKCDESNTVTTPITKSPRRLVATETNTNTEIGGNQSTANDDRDKLVQNLKEDVGVALTLIMALKKKMEDIHESIATRTEVAELEGSMRRKVRDVLKVAKKSVTVEKVSEYRIVEG